MFLMTATRHVARACAALCLSAVSAVAATHNVPAGGDLQGTINIAQPGDVILLARGATYIGNFRLTNTAGIEFITIRTDAPARELPAPGTRVSPTHTSVLAKLKSPNTSPALTALDGAHHWRIESVEFQANANGVGDIIVLGGGGTQTRPEQMPHDLVFDRVYIHGDPVVGQKRGIALNSGYTEIRNSYIADIKSTSQDAQAICGWNGSGPYLIENNYLEASGENVLFGGADPSVWNLVPSDITIRRNVMSKPLAWRDERWVVKNAFELKNARRVLVEGNVFENVWRSGQVGFAIVFTPRNQNGRAPWSVIEDVTFRYNIVRHASGGVNLTGFDDLQASAQTQRIQIAHNVFYDIDARWGGPGIFLQIGNSPGNIVVERNTVVHSGNAVNVYGRRSGAPWPVDGFVFRDNLMRHNRYGVIGDSQGVGNQTLANYFLNVIFERNALAGGDPAHYPAGNYFPTVAEFDAAFVNAASGDFTLVVGSQFRRWASDGGAIGADVVRVNAVRAGTAGTTPSAPGTNGYAVCRTGTACTSPPTSRRRP